MDLSDLNQGDSQQLQLPDCIPENNSEIQILSQNITCNIQTGNYKILDLVKRLHTPLTSQQDGQRKYASLLIAQVNPLHHTLSLHHSLRTKVTALKNKCQVLLVTALQVISEVSCSLLESDVSSLLTFFCSRMEDWPSQRASFQALTTLLNGHPPPPAATQTSLLTSFVTKVHVPALAQADRVLALHFLLCLLRTCHTAAHAACIDLVETVIVCIDEEKDPRCLLIGLQCIQQLPRIYTEADGNLGCLEAGSEELVELLSCYFPVAFAPNARDGPELTREVLVEAVEATLTCTPLFLVGVVPLAVQKLASSLNHAPIDSLSLLSACHTKFPADTLTPHARGVWNAIRPHLLAPADVSLLPDDLAAKKRVSDAVLTCLAAGARDAGQWSEHGQGLGRCVLDGSLVKDFERCLQAGGGVDTFHVITLRVECIANAAEVVAQSHLSACLLVISHFLGALSAPCDALEPHAASAPPITNNMPVLCCVIMIAKLLTSAAHVLDCDGQTENQQHEQYDDEVQQQRQHATSASGKQERVDVSEPEHGRENTANVVEGKEISIMHGEAVEKLCDYVKQMGHYVGTVASGVHDYVMSGDGAEDRATEQEARAGRILDSDQEGTDQSGADISREHVHVFLRAVLSAVRAIVRATSALGSLEGGGGQGRQGLVTEVVGNLQRGLQLVQHVLSVCQGSCAHGTRSGLGDVGALHQQCYVILSALSDQSAARDTVRDDVARVASDTVAVLSQRGRQFQLGKWVGLASVRGLLTMCARDTSLAPYVFADVIKIAHVAFVSATLHAVQGTKGSGREGDTVTCRWVISNTEGSGDWESWCDDVATVDMEECLHVVVSMFNMLQEVYESEGGGIKKSDVLVYCVTLVHRLLQGLFITHKALVLADNDSQTHPAPTITPDAFNVTIQAYVICWDHVNHVLSQFTHRTLHQAIQSLPLSTPPTPPPLLQQTIHLLHAALSHLLHPPPRRPSLTLISQTATALCCAALANAPRYLHHEQPVRDAVLGLWRYLPHCPSLTTCTVVAQYVGLVLTTGLAGGVQSQVPPAGQAPAEPVELGPQFVRAVTSGLPRAGLQDDGSADGSQKVPSLSIDDSTQAQAPATQHLLTSIMNDISLTLVGNATSARTGTSVCPPPFIAIERSPPRGRPPLPSYVLAFPPAARVLHIPYVARALHVVETIGSELARGSAPDHVSDLCRFVRTRQMSLIKHVHSYAVCGESSGMAGTVEEKGVQGKGDQQCASAGVGGARGVLKSRGGPYKNKEVAHGAYGFKEGKVLELVLGVVQWVMTWRVIKGVLQIELDHGRGVREGSVVQGVLKEWEGAGEECGDGDVAFWRDLVDMQWLQLCTMAAGVSGYRQILRLLEATTRTLRVVDSIYSAALRDSVAQEDILRHGRTVSKPATQSPDQTRLVQQESAELRGDIQGDMDIAGEAQSCVTSGAKVADVAMYIAPWSDTTCFSDESKVDTAEIDRLVTQLVAPWSDSSPPVKSSQSKTSRGSQTTRDQTAQQIQLGQSSHRTGQSSQQPQDDGNPRPSTNIGHDYQAAYEGVTQHQSCFDELARVVSDAVAMVGMCVADEERTVREHVVGCVDKIIALLLSGLEARWSHHVRESCLDALIIVMSLPYEHVHAHRDQVIQCINHCLDDNKRCVRLKAAKCRAVWSKW